MRNQNMFAIDPRWELFFVVKQSTICQHSRFIYIFMHCQSLELPYLDFGDSAFLRDLHQSLPGKKRNRLTRAKKIAKREAEKKQLTITLYYQPLDSKDCGFFLVKWLCNGDAELKMLQRLGTEN